MVFEVTVPASVAVFAWIVAFAACMAGNKLARTMKITAANTAIIRMAFMETCAFLINEDAPGLGLDPAFTHVMGVLDGRREDLHPFLDRQGFADIDR